MGKYTRGCCGWLIVALIAALVATAAMFAIMKRKPGGRHIKPLPVPGPPGAIDSKYGDALGVALQFFQVQKGEYSVASYPSTAFFSQCNAPPFVSWVVSASKAAALLWAGLTPEALPIAVAEEAFCLSRCGFTIFGGSNSKAGR